MSQAVDGAYADPEMMMVLYSMTATNMGSLFMMQDPADVLMAGSCTTKVYTGDTLPTPTAAGVCVMLTFPTDPTVDFVVTVPTTGIAHTAFFTAHVPTEFERDIHYLMQDVNDLTTAVPNEPLAQVPAAGSHDHGHRRRVADAGSCCTTAEQRGAWKQIVAYHDLCDHDDVPEFVEVGFHDYEESCELYFCNAVPSGYDGTICPSPPSPPPSPSSPAPQFPPSSDDGLSVGAIVGIAVAAAVALLAICCMIFMVSKERAGKPIFAQISEGATATKSTPDSTA